MTHPLHRPEFRWFFAGRLTSMLGTSMTPITLAFAVLDAAGNGADLGIVLTANLVAHLAFLLIGGATADRLSRRAVLIVGNAGCALTQGAVAAILITGAYSLPVVAGLELVNGALAAFCAPALRGLVPELVEADQLQRANALLASSRNAVRIIGPAVAGVLVATIGAGPAIAIDAAGFAIATICLQHIRSAVPVRAERTTMVKDIADGWRYFRSVRWLWPVSLGFFVVNLVQVGPWQVLGPQIVGAAAGPHIWGAVLSARAVGLLAGSLVLYRVHIRRPLRVTLCAGAVTALPLAAIGSGLSTTGLLVAAMIGGAGSATSAVAWETSLQQHIPGDRLSRVASVDDLLSFAAIPVGQLSAAPLAAAVSAPGVCLVAGGVAMIAAVTPLLNRTVRELRNPVHTTATPNG